jgi:hypothetical protein
MKRLIVLLLVCLSSCSSPPIIAPETDASDASSDANTDVADASIDRIYLTDAIFDGTPPDVEPVDVYGDATREFVSSDISVAESVSINSGDNAWLGAVINDSLISSIVLGQIDGNRLPYDSNGIYFVLTSSNVSVFTSEGDGIVEGYCQSYCGWHDSIWANVDGMNRIVRYGLIGDPETPICNEYGAGINVCSGYNGPDEAGALPPTPNGDWVADSMISVLCHETAETATDPDPTMAGDMKLSWITKPNDAGEFNELADQCAWMWGKVYGGEDGAWYNVGFGGHKYLIQQLWDLKTNDSCVSDLNGNPGFDVAEAGAPIMLVQNPMGVGPIDYFGGEVEAKPIRIYLIWYGWSSPNTSEPVIVNMFNTLGDSELWGVVREYFELTDGGGMTLPEAGTSDAAVEAGD